VSNTSTIIPGEVVSKLLCSEVDEEIIVPRIIRGDVKEMFIGEVGIDGRLVVSEGNVVMSSARMRDFFLLGVENSRSYS
jgi:hypothetical protein